MKIVGMIHVYNEVDIIKEVIEDLISQGIELVVLDNGSTDGTYEICKKFVDHGILKLIQFKTSIFELDLLLRMLSDMGLMQSPDWLIRIDADEFFESGIPNRNLKETIEQVDAEGYNLIQFDRFDFFMTDQDNETVKSTKDRLKYYSYQGDFLYRAWKCFPGIRIGDVGGHYPIFPEGLKYKIFPKKFIMRHYPSRTKEQAEKKISNAIRGRGQVSKGQLPLDDHQKKILKPEFTKKVDHRLLIKYEENNKWNFKMKYHPFEVYMGGPKRNEIFSDDGTLKVKPRTVYDYKLLLDEKQSKWIARAIYRRWIEAKRIFFNRNKNKA